ncbi:Vesicle transport protein SFT2A [Trichinella murrelli]|uniref:Vesicle transport protein n=1 Tax=Trichinella murrelli TaxID=144512 RepID=A0A0V0U0B6_9BILA|nr:Vesicle transport protein SFT2A [Trichinella murrelli]
MFNSVLMMRMRFLTRIFSSNEEEEEDIISDVTNGNTLSWSTRIKCFLFCFLLGIFLSVMGSVSIFFRNFVMFSILFSIGSVMSMASTCFLMGPVKQLKKMVDPTRLISTVVVILMIILTLFSAFYERCPVSSVCVLPISGDDLVFFVVYSIREIRREKLLANVRLIDNLPTENPTSFSLQPETKQKIRPQLYLHCRCY